MTEHIGWAVLYAMIGTLLCFAIFWCALSIWERVRDWLIMRWFPELYDAAFHHHVRSKRP